MSRMEMEAWSDPDCRDFHVTIHVPRAYLEGARPAKMDMSHLIDMPQFFGMLEDVVCLKLGIEPPRTNKKGHNT